MIIRYLFTASKKKRRIIKRIFSNKLDIKVTKIGTINSINKKSMIIDHKKREITLKNKGYLHKF